MLVVDQVLENRQGDAARRIVTASGQFVAAPDAQSLKHIVDCETRAFRKMLAEIAETTGADWSAEVRTGSLGAHLASVADAWDILVVGHRTLHSRQGHVVVIGDASRDGSGVLSVAARLASELQTEVERVGLPPGDVRRTDWFPERLDRLNASVVLLDAAAIALEGYQGLTTLLTVARCPIVIFRSAESQPKLEQNSRSAPLPDQNA